ncbi:MAG: HAMP domain-containing histidine kinase, partial [Ignavibacteria bacterium]|nr:HAMP domain-containing histidine kinase [Ignavibacteria bacterium]
MLNLVPKYTYDFEQLWIMISQRNRLFIKIRFFTVASLIVFLLLMEYVLEINFTQKQLSAIVLIILALFVSNLIYMFVDRSGIVRNDTEGFNQLHFAFNQIVVDLLAIFALNYYTGGVESVFYMFFVFHMIIGSMILPGFIIYTLAGSVVFLFTTTCFFEFFEIIPHHHFGNLIETDYYKDLRYVFITCTAFPVLIFFTVVLSNNIARAHFIRSQRLKEALDKIEEAEKIKMKYTMGIVHEIKSPVVGVQSNLDLVLEGYSGTIDEKAKNRIIKARARTDEAINIINDVLNISKVKLLEQIKKEEIDVFSLVSSVVKKKNSDAVLKKIHIQIADFRKTKIISGDRVMLELALSNLIGNAIKYNTPGGNVEIILKNADEDIMIVIADDGIGIPDNDKEKLFSEFYRSSDVRRKGVEGTGLGLIVVKEIIEQHKGVIVFNSPSRISS